MGSSGITAEYMGIHSYKRLHVTIWVNSYDTTHVQDLLLINSDVRNLSWLEWRMRILMLSMRHCWLYRSCLCTIGNSLENRSKSSEGLQYRLVVVLIIWRKNFSTFDFLLDT